MAGGYSAWVLKAMEATFPKLRLGIHLHLSLSEMRENFQGKVALPLHLSRNPRRELICAIAVTDEAIFHCLRRERCCELQHRMANVKLVKVKAWE